MPIVNVTELKAFLSELGLYPKKKLSQNFLIDANILNKMLDASGVQKDDHVLEIGSGAGAFTEALLKRGVRVTAVELDHVLAKELERFESLGDLKVFEADILDFPIEEHIKKGTRVVANLPYHITSPIFERLAPMHENIHSITALVQKEMAERMCAKPKSKAYSSFTIFLDFYGKLNYAFTASASCFYPAPSVDSAVITMHLKEPPNDVEAAAFFKLTRTAFNQRRKMLRASLKEIYPEIEATLQTIGFKGTERPEELSKKDFIKILKLK